MLNRSLIVLAAAGALAACEPAPEIVGVPDMRIATADEVSACQPTKIYTTTTGVFGSAVGTRTVEIARNSTMVNAQEDGANTVVFEQGGPGDDTALGIRARGYIC